MMFLEVACFVLFGIAVLVFADMFAKGVMRAMDRDMDRTRTIVNTAVPPVHINIVVTSNKEQ